MSHDTNTCGRHRADNNRLAGGNGSETKIRRFYGFERRKELDGGAVIEECSSAMMKAMLEFKVPMVCPVTGGCPATQGDCWISDQMTA